MGIFGSRKKTYVSSVVYNMAGDEFRRPNYLRTTVVGAVISNAPSIADSLTNSYLEGPGMRFRRFHRWAERTDYNDLIGLSTGSLQTGNSIDPVVLQGELPGSVASLQSYSIGPADYTYWADQHVLENFPHLTGTSYTSDINEETNEITITWADDSLTVFTPVGYTKTSNYLYAVYFEGLPEEEQSVVTGSTVFLGPGDSFPSTTGWTEISYDDTGGEIHGVWERVTYMGMLPMSTRTYSLKEIMYQDTVGGSESYRIDTQEIWHAAASDMKVFIYEYGSGNATLDEMFTGSSDMNGFYPVIPIRLNGKFLSEEFQPTIYEQVKKGYRKATTGKLDKLIEDLEENEDIGDIDYAYIVFGVCLNVLEQSSRKYIYTFFQEILNDYTQSGSAEYSAWQTTWNAARDSWETWIAWREAQSDSGNPLYGTTEPVRLDYPPLPTNSLRVSTGANPTINYDITISWSTMSETTGVGLLKPDAKPDELWFSKGDASYNEEVIWVEEGEDDGGIVIVGGRAMPGARTNTNAITLNWQVTATTWRRLTIVGLTHRNLIYGGKAVEIDAHEALDDAEESGFIIPLHDGVFRALGLVDGTQMTTACSFIVFNCYQVVKKKWYQTGLFAIILIIIIIVVAFYTGYIDPNAVGLLGGNAAVGAALVGAGASVAVATIVGAVANALAAMLVMRMITSATTKLFGETWGAVIGAIVSIIVLDVGTAMANGQTMSSAFSGLMRADNLMRLASAVGNGYAAYLKGATSQIYLEQQEVMENYEKESREIRNAWEKNLGGEGGIIDPLMFTDAFAFVMESNDSFLQRTLLTGQDIAEMSMDMLTNFANMTINNDLPT